MENIVVTVIVNCTMIGLFVVWVWAIWSNRKALDKSYATLVKTHER